MNAILHRRGYAPERVSIDEAEKYAKVNARHMSSDNIYGGRTENVRQSDPGRLL